MGAVWWSRGHGGTFLAGAASLFLILGGGASQAGATGAASAVSMNGPPTAPCDQHALQAALNRGGQLDFRQSCTLNLTRELTIPRNDLVTLNGLGHQVIINGGSTAYHPRNVFTRVFLVSGALTLENLTVAHGEAIGSTAINGGDGAAGKSGTSPGQAGGPGKPGGAAGDGGAGQGGGISVKKGASLVTDHVNFTDDLASGAPGGAGGSGGPAARAGRRSTGRRVMAAKAPTAVRQATAVPPKAEPSTTWANSL